MVLRGRRILIQSLFLLLFSQVVFGERVLSHGRAISKTRGYLWGDGGKRRGKIAHVKGERKLMMGKEGAVVESNEDSETMVIPIEHPSNDEKLDAEGSEEASTKKKAKKVRSIKGNRSKLKGKTAGKKAQSGSGKRSKLEGTSIEEVSTGEMGEFGPIPEDSEDQLLGPTDSDSVMPAIKQSTTAMPSLAPSESILISSPTTTIATTHLPTLEPTLTTPPPFPFLADPGDSIDESSTPTESPTAQPSVMVTPASTDLPTGTPMVVAKEEQVAASYEFEPGQVSEPTASEIFSLEIATTAFYIGIFSDEYANNPDTTFVNIVAQVEDLTYSPNENPPIEIEWSFSVAFDSTSAVVPSSEEILELIYGNEETLDEYIDIYLHNNDDVWGAVMAVTYKESLAEDDVGSSSSEAVFPSTKVETSLLLEFNPGSLSAEPSQEEYQRLTNALGLFLTALLSQAYSDADDAMLATVTASLTEGIFFDQSDSLQANFELQVFFSADTSNVPTADSIFAIVQESAASLLRFFLENFSWEETDPWNEIADLLIEPSLPIERSWGMGNQG